MLRRYKIRDYDFKLILLIAALTLIGILAIGSAADEDYQSKQILGMVVGLLLMVVVSLIDYSFLLKFKWVFYLTSLVILVLTDRRLFGVEHNGAYRWIRVAGIQFQPSEASKILLILFFAQFIMKYKEKLNRFSVIMAALLLLAPHLYLIYKQPDLSTSIVVAAIFATILFVGGLSYKIIAGVLGIGIPAGAILFYLLLQPGQTLINEYQQLRILAWLYKDEYATSTGYQQINSMMAIGSGMLTGKGYRNNVAASVVNGNFLSEPHTDFIFAVIGEELGFIGTCAVVLLLLLITLECLSVARRAKDIAGRAIAAGMGALIGFQGFFNIGVTTGLLPNTGLTLPFVSAGLTSLVTLYVGMGIVLNVRLQAKKERS